MEAINHILLIDSNATDADAICALLATTPAFSGTVTRALSLGEGRALLGEARFEVVLLSLDLPDSKGLDTLRELHAAAPEIPIVILSTSDDETLAAAAVSLGAQDHLARQLLDGPGLLRALRYAIARQQSDQALLEREERFRALVEHSWDAYTIINADGTIAYISPAVSRTAGLLPDQVQGMHVLDFVHEGWRDSFQAGFAACLQRPGEPIQVEARVKREDGGWRYLEGILTNLLHVPAVRGIVNNTRDITERYQAEHLFRTAVEVSPAGMLMVDHDGRIVLANRQVEAMFGYQEGELQEQSLEQLLPTRFRSVHTHLFRSFLAAPEKKSMGVGRDLYGLHRDGHEIPIEVGLAPVDNDAGRLVLASIIDISERKQTQARLADEAIRTQALMNNASDGITILDSNGRVLEVNPRACEILGRSAEGVIGRHISTFVSPRSATRSTEFDHSVTTGYGMHHGIEVVRPDGEIVLVDFSNSRVDLKDGSVVLSIARDMTEQRRLESQLRHAQKLEAVGRLAGGVAHDFNNLLTVIYGYLDLLRNTLEGKEDALADLEQIHLTADRAAALVRQLLAFSRQQVMKTSIVNLNDIVVEVMEMLRRLIGDSITIVTDLAPQLGHVRVDPRQMEQVLVNLAVNARDAMPNGGTVRIVTRNVQAPLASGELCEQVSLSVVDTGTGMDDSVILRLFEPFFTTKQDGKGTGLGLPMVHGIIEQSGGRIEVSSEPDAGSSFTVLLPRVEAPPEQAPATDQVPATDSPAIAATVTGQETILVTDDQPEIRELIRNQLEASGYTVLEAGSTAAALAAADDYPGDIALLVTDILMPGGNGLHLATRLREQRPGIPVLFISGFVADAAGLPDLELPRSAFLQKPFTARQLVAQMRTLLDQG